MKVQRVAAASFFAVTAVEAHHGAQGAACDVDGVIVRLSFFGKTAGDGVVIGFTSA